MRSTFHRLNITRYTRIDSGRPTTTVAAWRVYTPSMKSITTVSAPVITAHTIRSQGGPSESVVEAFEVMFAITSEPESAEVT